MKDTFTEYINTYREIKKSKIFEPLLSIVPLTNICQRSTILWNVFDKIQFTNGFSFPDCKRQRQIVCDILRKRV